MKNTDIKNYMSEKTKELTELQGILFSLKSSSKTSVVYQNTYYDASVLVGKIKKIESQMEGALQVIKQVESGSWGVSHLCYIENLAKTEFGYHVSVDAQYALTLTDGLLGKILGEIESEGKELNVELLAKRLTGIKEKFLRNVKSVVKFSHRDEWIRDRYFEIASFITFEDEDNSVVPVLPKVNEKNSIYDVITSGDKTIEELKQNNLYVNVAIARSEDIKNATIKDLSFESK